MNRRPLKFLHTSDVHLGAYDHGKDDAANQKRAHFHDVFRRVIDVGRKDRVDFMVVAGDFFDNARVMEDTLHFAAEQIARLEAPVIICPGNHDHVGPGSVYDRFDLTSVARNLTIMRAPAGEYVYLDHLGVELWGRSHTEREPDFAPFRDAPGRREAEWHIGVGHGHYLHPGSGTHPSYHIYEEHLELLDHDYIALGHWEQQTRVTAGGMVAAYSGAPQGLAGTTGGRVLLVHLEEDGSVRLVSKPLDENGPLIDHDDIPLLQGGPPPRFRQW